MTCNNCGKRLRSEVTFCPRCGAAVPVPDDEQKAGEDGQMRLVGLADITAQATQGKKKLSKKQLWIRIGIIAGAVLLALAVVLTGLYFATFGRINRESELNESDLGINQALVDRTGVQNIALFGLDSRSNNETGRSDALIILSIDRDHNAIKMTSIARDSLVNIGTPKDKYGDSKITHAFAWGGAKLAVQTLNTNFGMNITDYVYINFFEFVELVDYVGGVMIDVNASEARVMNNTYAPELLHLGFNYKKVTAGYQRLSGAQALAYSRDRYTGSETDRGNRHKEVLQALFDEVKTLSVAEFPGLVGKVMSMCHTTLTDAEMLSIATWAMTSNPAFSQFSMPSPECKAKGGNWNDGQGWVWRYDMGLATAVLHKYIYEVDVPYTTTASRTPLTTTTTTTAPTGSTTTTTTTAPTGTTTTTTTEDTITNPSGEDVPTDGTTNSDTDPSGGEDTDPSLGEDTDPSENTSQTEDTTSEPTGPNESTPDETLE